jgi:hypothetical protein
VHLLKQQRSKTAALMQPHWLEQRWQPAATCLALQQHRNQWQQQPEVQRQQQPEVQRQQQLLQPHPCLSQQQPAQQVQLLVQQQQAGV